MTVREELERRLQTLPDLTRRRSRFGDAFSYFVGDREIAHFHGDLRMDVRLTRARLRELRDAGPVDPRITMRGPSAEWATVRVAAVRDLSLAVQLVEEAIRANS